MIQFTHMKANTVGKNYYEADVAYLAGLIDGDGAIMACIEKHSEKKFGFRVRVSVKVTQKEKTLVTFLWKLHKMGRVRQNRTTYDWIVLDQKDVLKLLGMIEPYSKSKTRQIRLAKMIIDVKIINKNDLMKVAKYADALSRFNVRSKNRRMNYASMIK